VLLFFLFSIIDFCLTFMLIRQSGGRIFEGNPIASAWLADYGWGGLVIYKLIAILGVATLIIIISGRRPRTAVALAAYACLAAGCVVLYSQTLLPKPLPSKARPSAIKQAEGQMWTLYLLAPPGEVAQLPDR
jgi:hypothetical protein